MGSNKEWLDEYARAGAFWHHSGNPRHPHALLSSGKHSDSFFDAKKIVTDDKILFEVCADIITGIHNSKFSFSLPDIVIGCGGSANAVADKIGYILGTPHVVYAKKIQRGSVTIMEFENNVCAGMSALLVDDVCTTGETLNMTADLAHKNGLKIIMPAIALLNRSAASLFGKIQVYAPVHHPMSEWMPGNCPLCDSGSIALPPKKNWDKFTNNKRSSKK